MGGKKMFFGSKKISAPTNVQLVTKYATALEISWNFIGSEVIEYFEIYVNGVFNNKTTQTKSFALQLMSASSYGITVRGKILGVNKFTGFSLPFHENTASSEIIEYGSLISYWDVNNNVKDRVGHCDGILTNATYIDSDFGKSLNFASNPSKMNSYGWNERLSILQGNTTFIAYVKSISGDKQTIFSSTENPLNGYGGLSIFNSDRGLWFYNGQGNSSSGYQNTGAGSFSLGEYHFVALVRDRINGTIKIYIDGVEKSNKNTFGIGGVDLIDFFTFGYSPNKGEGGQLFGEMSAIGVFRKALSASEIIEIQNLFLNKQQII